MNKIVFYRKVACEELSLECASSSKGEGAKLADIETTAGDHQQSSKKQHKGSENLIHRYYSSVLKRINKG